MCFSSDKSAIGYSYLNKIRLYCLLRLNIKDGEINMRLQLKMIGFLMLGLLMLGGCASKHPNLVELGKVKNIDVIETQKARENGFLVIKVAVKNTSSRNQNINYRFQWLDDQGFPVGKEESWRSKLIYGGQSTFITSIAPVMNAVDFRIEMQEP